MDDRRRTGTGGAGPAPPIDRWARAARVAEPLAVVAVVLALSTGAVAVLVRGWAPVSDLALLELRVRDVPAHLPLVGAYSRLGWSHPGPTWFLLLALPYRLLGATPAALAVAALALHGAAVTGAWWVARARDRLAGALVLLALTVVMVGRPAVDLRDPWNPYVSLVLAGTLVVLGWAAAERRPWPVALVLPVGTLLVQAHVGALPVVAAVTAAAAALAVLPRPGGSADDRGPLPWRAAAAGAGVTALLWVPPLVEQLTGDPGNLGRLVSSAGGGEPAGPGVALRLLSDALAVPPSWAGGSVPTALGGLRPGWAVPVLAVPVVGAVVVAVRARDRPALRALAVAGAALVAAVVAVARVDGPVYEYLLVWLGPVVAVAVALSAWVLLAHLLGGPGQERARVVLLAGTAVLAVPLGLGVARAGGPDGPTEAAVGRLAPALLADAGGRPGDGGPRAALAAEPDFDALAALPGLVAALERGGVAVAAPPEDADRYGDHRVRPLPGAPRYLVAPAGRVGDLRDDGWRVVAVVDPFRPAERRRLAALTAEREVVVARRAAAAAAGRPTDDLDEQLLDVVGRAEDLRGGRVALAVLARG